MDQPSVFRHARELQQARTFAEVGRVAFAAVRSLTRYRHSWLAVLEPDAPSFARILQVSGEKAELIFEECPVVPVAGDEMMRELISARQVVVVDDARVDPRTNKEIVGRLLSRTIINVPMLLESQVLGSLGLGTFGDEGVLPPTREELDALVVFSVQLAAAFERVRAAERQRRVEEERQLLERRLEAVQRVELMGVLAAGVAHDLNNLLSVVNTSLDVLSEGPDPEAAEDGRLAVQRAAEVCGQLLALGRAHTTRREPIDLNARLEATLRLVRGAIPAGVRVNHGKGTHPRVVGDPVQLDQAFANLLINARDAVGERGTIEVVTDDVTFDASVQQRSGWARPGHFARVSVLDSGAGVPPAILDRIFDPLFTTKQHGTGLGLAVVASVMSQHQGLVHCESSPGHTRFELYLPVAEEPAGVVLQ